MNNTKKELRSEYIVKGVEILSGILIGVFVWKISDEESTVSALLSIVVGLLGSLIIILFIESFKQQNDIKQVRSTYSRLIDIISDGKNNSEEKLSYILKYGIVTFVESHMPVVWRQLLWGVKESYYATNYIKSDDIYDQGWSEAAIAIQKAKAFGEQVDIKKVFIIDSQEELDALEENIKKQLNSGVDARYIFKEKMDNSKTLIFNTEKIASIDFGIFDNDSVFVWKLKDDRSFIGGELKFKVDEIKAYREFFTQLFIEASPINHK